MAALIHANSGVHVTLFYQNQLYDELTQILWNNMRGSYIRTYVGGALFHAIASGGTLCQPKFKLAM